MLRPVSSLIELGLLIWMAMSSPTRLFADELSATRIVGVAGCTAASCHGGKSLIGGEATAWLTRDTAHRRAYDVLFNETSVRMANQLGLKAAHTEARCLACHSTEAAHPDAVKGERFAIEFGIGCESCHGAAGAWVARHTERTWRSLAASQKAELGFHDLRSASARAEKCAECHVGSPRATVNHDLIAAGHPRLTFEMSAYHDLLPKHWDSAAELRRDPAQSLRLWAIGQGVSAKAISDVAVARAENALNSGASHATPDLAEFDCHACHHDLAEPARGRPTPHGPLGAPRWGSWSIHPARLISRQSQLAFGQDGATADASLTKLIGLVEQSRLGAVRAETLLPTARQASHDLKTWSQALEFASISPAQTVQLRHRLIAAESNSDWLPTWDGQTQRFLAIAALNQSLRGMADQKTFAIGSLIEFPKRLRFPVGYATPREFSPDDLETLFRELREGQR